MAGTERRYHARLAPSARRDAQQRFMSGDVRAMVATKAFGLGIDKPDIRLVVHHQVPDSLGELPAGGGTRRTGGRARARLDAMTGYAESTRCRVQILREYFGEHDVPACGQCDNCEAPLGTARA